MQPNANLNIFHCLMLTGAMLAIYGWGLICLEADLAARSATQIAAK